MPRRALHASLCLLLSSASTGCFSALPFTTAHTLPPGQMELDDSFEAGAALPPPGSSPRFDPVLNVHVGVRMGLKDRVDAQLRLSPSDREGVLKFQALRSPTWNVAIAAVARNAGVESAIGGSWGGGGRLVVEADNDNTWPDLVFTAELGAFYLGPFEQTFFEPGEVGYGAGAEAYAVGSVGAVFHLTAFAVLQPVLGVMCRRRPSGVASPYCVPQLGVALRFGH